MKSIHATRFLNLVLVSIFALALLFLASCSKDSVETAVETEKDSQADEESKPDKESTPHEDADNSPDTTENIDSNLGSDVVFEQGLVLHADRQLANFVVSENEYNKFITGQGDLKMVSKTIYQYLKDDFDFLIILSVEEEQPDDLFFGRSTSVQNLTEGLGGGVYNLSTNYGSAGKLKSMVYMPRSEYIRTGPFLHEIAHTWGNSNFLPTTVGGHWGYAGTAGQLGGFDELIDNGDGTYQGKLNGSNGFGTFANGGNSIVYGNLELYLMGLIPYAELEPVEVAVNPIAGSSFGSFSADMIDEHSPEMMVVANGVRNPSFETSQKKFTALAIIISTTAIDDAKITAINTNLENFSRQAAPDWNGTQNFHTATQGKASFTFLVAEESIK